VARVRVLHWHVIMTFGAFGGAVVTYLQYRRLWVAAVAGLSGAAVGNGIVAFMYRRHSIAGGPDEPATRMVRAEGARTVHWTKKVGTALMVLGLADFLLAVSRRDIVNLAFGVVFVINGLFLVLRRAQ